MATPENILYTTDTEHDHYEVVERVYEGRQARVLFSGKSRAAQSGVALDDNTDLLFDYNQRFLELANALYPKRILVIGGGAFTLPVALLTALPDAVITVVEIDPGLQHIAECYFGLQPSERLHIEFMDGRVFLQESSDTYDLIVLDVFSELHIPDHFLTIEFVRLLRSRLTEGGAVAMNIIASYKGLRNGLIKSQIAAYKRYFERLDVYPAASDLLGWMPQNLVLLAQTSPTDDYKPYVRYAAIDMPDTSDEDIVVDNPM